jgi:hypothetical protein
MAGEIRANNGDHQLSAFQRVAQFILNHLICINRYDRQNAVGAINGLLCSHGGGCRSGSSVLGHVHLDPMRRSQSL